MSKDKLASIFKKHKTTTTPLSVVMSFFQEEEKREVVDILEKNNVLINEEVKVCFKNVKERKKYIKKWIDENFMIKEGSFFPIDDVLKMEGCLFNTRKEAIKAFKEEEYTYNRRKQRRGQRGCLQAVLKKDYKPEEDYEKWI